MMKRSRVRPETQKARREVGPRMAVQRAFSEKRPSVKNGPFYPVGSGFAVLSDVSPNIANVGLRATCLSWLGFPALPVRRR